MMPIYYVKHTHGGGAIVKAASRSEAIGVVNFGGRVGKLTARRAKPGDRSWSPDVVARGDYTERDGVVFLTEQKIRRLFSIPLDVPVFSGESGAAPNTYECR
jgi:hypothetical protein